MIGLVSHSFLVQNRFYATQTLQATAQDNARAATELMAREIRNTVEDGVVVAGRRTLTVRSPMAVVVLCNRQGGGDADVMTDGGESAIDVAEVAGLAVRNDSTWEYQNATWSYIDDNNGNAADDCFGNGADTVGIRNDFHRIRRLDNLFSPAPAEGDVVMIFRETTFMIRPSQLDSTTYALYRGTFGQPLVEFATGVDTTAHFEYRTGGTTYADTISANLGTIDVVRIVAALREHAPTGGVEDVTFGWAVNVPLRYVR